MFYEVIFQKNSIEFKEIQYNNFVFNPFIITKLFQDKFYVEQYNKKLKINLDFLNYSYCFWSSYSGNPVIFWKNKTFETFYALKN